MKLNYDKATDTLLIVLTGGRIDETEEIRPGVLADFDERGGLVSMEILNATRKVDQLAELIGSRGPSSVALEMR